MGQDKGKDVTILQPTDEREWYKVEHPLETHLVWTRTLDPNGHYVEYESFDRALDVIRILLSRGEGQYRIVRVREEVLSSSISKDR